MKERATTSDPGREDPRFIAVCPRLESLKVWIGGATALSGVHPFRGHMEL